MFDITTAKTLMPRELDAIIERSQQLSESQWTTTIAWLPGWTVTDLLDHVGLAAGMQAEAFENLAEGSLDIPAYPNPQGSTRSVIGDNLKRGRDRFVEAINGIDDSYMSELTPLPFGIVPTPVAVQIAVLEYGYHRWDLEHALGDTHYDLPGDIAPHGFEFLGGLLPMLSAGGAAPPSPLAFDLASPHGSLVLEHAGEGWQPLETPTVDSVCFISADVATLALFGMGRIPTEADVVTVTGSAADEASRFKSYFPGP